MGHDIPRWAHCSLGLFGDLAKEWDGYVFNNLNQGNIVLGPDSDKLVWSSNPKEGSVSASLAYSSLICDENSRSVEWWSNCL